MGKDSELSSEKQHRDGWSKFEIITKFLATILIPIVVGYLGLEYKNQRERIEQDNIKEDRITNLIKHLGSQNDLERGIALTYAMYLNEKGLFPNSLKSSLPLIATKGKTDTEKQYAKTIIVANTISQNNKINKINSSVLSQQLDNGSFLIYPQNDGNDVLIPHLLIKAIPDFNDNKPVYAATDLNGWLVSGRMKANDESLRLTTMTREGYVWRARGMFNKRFHPAQLLNPSLSDPYTGNNIGWAKIENVYSLSEPFVDLSGSGPCILIK